MSELARRIRQSVGSYAAEGFFRGLSAMGQLHPAARPERHGVTVERNVPYASDGAPEHRLDVYRPIERGGPLPIVFYIHGGGFRILSKDTHWLMGLAFARRGYLVFNIDYRLAPRHPFPAAIEDACLAYQWMVAHAESRGGDLSRVVIAGESAGGNLATSIAVATSFRRPEPFARAVFDTGVTPLAVVAACPMLQVSDTDRFQRRKPLPAWLRDRITEVEHAYLRGWQSPDSPPPAGALDLADPLLLLEGDAQPERPLPPFFVPVGTRDPLLDDTRRMAAALARRHVECDARYYPGEGHAFHAMVFRKNARLCWHDTFEFLDRTLSQGAPAIALRKRFV